MPKSIDKNLVFDAAVFDRENTLVAFVEVKTNPLNGQWPPQLRGLLNQCPLPHPEFLFAIDPDSIQLFQLNGNGEPENAKLSHPVVCLNTADVLSHYDPDFVGKRIFHQYFVSLVEAWIRDVAYHWKSTNPPGFEQLKKMGFTERVAGGSTRTEGVTSYDYQSTDVIDWFATIQP